MDLTKPTRPQDSEYLEYVRNNPCCICKLEGETIIAHHIETGGMSTKCSDYKTVALCHVHHTELHDKGKDTFAEKHCIDYYRECHKLLEAWVIGLKVVAFNNKNRLTYS